MLKVRDIMPELQQQQQQQQQLYSLLYFTIKLFIYNTRTHTHTNIKYKKNKAFIKNRKAEEQGYCSDSSDCLNPVRIMHAFYSL